MPLPLYPNFARSARANLLPEFEQVADENKENISQGSDIVLDDTIVPTSEDSKWINCLQLIYLSLCVLCCIVFLLWINLGTHPDYVYLPLWHLI